MGIVAGASSGIGLNALGRKATVVSGLFNKFYAWENRLLPRSTPLALFGFLIKQASNRGKPDAIKDLSRNRTLLTHAGRDLPDHDQGSICNAANLQGDGPFLSTAPVMPNSLAPAGAIHSVRLKEVRLQGPYGCGPVTGTCPASYPRARSPAGLSASPPAGDRTAGNSAP